MKIGPLVALGLIVSLAGCNDDKYTGKVENAGDLAACMTKAYLAAYAYRTKLKLKSEHMLKFVEDSQSLEKLMKSSAEDQINIWKIERKSTQQMVQSAEWYNGKVPGEEYFAACKVGYITREQVVWPDF